MEKNLRLQAHKWYVRIVEDALLLAILVPIYCFLVTGWTYAFKRRLMVQVVQVVQVMQGLSGLLGLREAHLMVVVP